MTHYLEPKEKVLQDLGTDAGGLSSAEAAKRAEQYGRNKLAEGKKESLLHRFLSQLADPMIIILLVAAVISAVTTIVSNQVNGGGESFADVFKTCMEGPLKEMPLTKEDREEFFLFVSENGFMDGQMQMRMIDTSRERLEEKSKRLEQENAEKCRMAVGLGAMGGLLIILILC